MNTEINREKIAELVNWAETINTHKWRLQTNATNGRIVYAAESLEDDSVVFLLSGKKKPHDMQMVSVTTADPVAMAIWATTDIPWAAIPTVQKIINEFPDAVIEYAWPNGGVDFWETKEDEKSFNRRAYHEVTCRGIVFDVFKDF